MSKMFLCTILVGATVSLAVAQQPPAQLPQNVTNPPAQPPILNGLTVVRFDPVQLALKRVEGRYQLWAGTQFLKDFGLQEHEAHESLQLIRSLRYSQFGAVAGATPAFEFWLTDEEAAKGGLTVKNVIPFNNKTLKLSQIAGAWVIHDGKQMLFNFGNLQESALSAMAIMKKYSFNQLGFVGIPTPVMTYLTLDPHPRIERNSEPLDLKDVLATMSQQGLMLPNVGYVGTRVSLETRKLELVRFTNDWAIVHGKDVLAHFGNNTPAGREGLRLLQDSRVNEICFIGKSGFPIFLSNGQAPRNTALGFNNTRIHPTQMKAQLINSSWCIVEETRIIFEFGENRGDAEMLHKVLQYYQFDQICPIGDVNNGGFRLLTKSR